VVREVFAYLDEPLADASILPTYLLSRFTREHVTVALGGDGGDELFAGYPTFDAETYARIYTRIPRALRATVIEPLVRALPVGDGHMTPGFKAQKFIEGAAYPMPERHARWLGAWSDDHERSELLLDVSSVNPYYTYASDSARTLNDLLWQYARTYMMDEVLVKVDRASMAHGLEVRTPFLDTALVEYAMSLPYEYKHARGVGKRILKAAMRDKLPDSIIDRTKKGFGIPLARWLKHELNPLMRELLGEDAIKKSAVFNYKVVKRIMDEHESGTRDHRKKLWTLMVFQMWHTQWIH
jgi:asparagine synthase (glutamine-hydrolysing)